MKDHQEYLDLEWRVISEDALRAIRKAASETEQENVKRGIPRSGPAVKFVARAIEDVITPLVRDKINPFLASTPTLQDVDRVRAILDSVRRSARSQVVSYGMKYQQYAGVARQEIDKSLDLLVGRIDLPFISYLRTARSQPQENEALVSFAKSGAPGRPSAKQIWMEIFEHRLKKSECLGSLQSEAEAVAEAFNADNRYSEWPNVSARTVENGIREKYNQLGRPRN